jgi:DNA repair protein RadC
MALAASVAGSKAGRKGELMASAAVYYSELDLLALLLGLSSDPESLDLLHARLCREQNLQWLRDPEAESEEFPLPLVWRQKLQACFELADRVIYESLKLSDVMHGPKDIQRFLLRRLGHFQTEQFAVVFLDSAHHMLEFKILFSGTVNSVRVYPRVVVQQALAVNASALILSHNHPSGSWQVSAADIDLTEELRVLVEKFDIRILDHLIVAQGTVVSMVERGLL